MRFLTLHFVSCKDVANNKITICNGFKTPHHHNILQFLVDFDFLTHAQFWILHVVLATHAFASFGCRSRERIALIWSCRCCGSTAFNTGAGIEVVAVSEWWWAVVVAVGMFALWSFTILNSSNILKGLYLSTGQNSRMICSISWTCIQNAHQNYAQTCFSCWLVPSPALAACPLAKKLRMYRNTSNLLFKKSNIFLNRFPWIYAIN